MRAYISVSFSKRKLVDEELTAIIDALNSFKIEPIIFVDKYKFDLADEHQMMQQAMNDIDNSDLLIAETSHKAIGIGIEAGYAKAKGKPVVYIRKENAEHSTTVSGISDFKIVYKDVDDLREKVKNILNKILRI